eukprot:365118-Chlamydomonas_euryale.AAC.2
MPLQQRLDKNAVRKLAGCFLSLAIGFPMQPARFKCTPHGSNAPHTVQMHGVTSLPVKGHTVTLNPTAKFHGVFGRPHVLHSPSSHSRPFTPCDFCRAACPQLHELEKVDQERAELAEAIARLEAELADAKEERYELQLALRAAQVGG